MLCVRELGPDRTTGIAQQTDTMQKCGRIEGSSNVQYVLCTSLEVSMVWVLTLKIFGGWGVRGSGEMQVCGALQMPGLGPCDPATHCRGPATLGPYSRPMPRALWWFYGVGGDL